MNKGLLFAAIFSISCSSIVFAGEACDETVLHGYMVNIKDEMRSMSSDVRSGDNAAAVQRAGTLISLFEKARNETPYKFSADNLQGSQLKEQQSEYTKVVGDMIVILKKLESALQAGDTAQVKVLFGKIGGQRKLGHGSFKANC